MREHVRAQKHVHKASTNSGAEGSAHCMREHVLLCAHVHECTTECC